MNHLKIQIELGKMFKELDCWSNKGLGNEPSPRKLDKNKFQKNRRKKKRKK